jgi:hypothetical protein
VTLAGSTLTQAGKATFTFTSQGAYAGCTITFSSSNVSSVNATAVWTAGGADHMTCSFFPNPLPPNNTSTSTGQVVVRDVLGNTVTAGTYSVNFTRQSGSATTQLTSSPQNSSNGVVNFQVRANSTVGTDTYGPSLASGTLPGTNTTCTITIQ